MKHWRIFLVLVTGLCILPAAQAHRFAPSLLKVTETVPQQYNMVWKTPAQGVSNVPLEPRWPESCEVVNASPPQLEGTGVVTSWQLECADLGVDGLVGETLGVSGLGANQASAMVMVSLLDGRQYQQVLDTEQPEFVVPAESTTGDVAGDYTGSAWSISGRALITCCSCLASCCWLVAVAGCSGPSRRSRLGTVLRCPW